jgi:adenylate kinase
MSSIGNILLLGPPGAGKGTQAQFLAKQFNLARIDTGSLIRTAIQTGSELGLKAKEFVGSGKLVPDQLVIDLILSELSKAKEAGQNFLLDGFPRNVAQAEALDVALQQNSLILNNALEVKVDFDKLVERITGRRICTNKACNTVYHLKFSPPKQENICDLCGSPLYQRDDDRAELVKARLETYQTETLPLVAFYKNKGNLLEVNGNQSTEAVSQEILTKLA